MFFIPLVDFQSISGIIFLQINRKKCIHMPVITPISDLRNYGTILEKVTTGRPVFLTRNGKGAYTIHTIEDEENFQRAEAMIQLMAELNAGIRSAENEGWVSEDELFSQIKAKRVTGE